MSQRSVPIDDRDPESRLLRQTLLDLATAYNEDRQTYQREFNLVVDDLVALIRSPADVKPVLAQAFHSGVIVTFAALSAMAHEWFEGDFVESARAIEKALDEVIAGTEPPSDS